MPVTKQTYTINSGFTRTEVATALRSALIDAGLMTEWYDSFASNADRLCRVLRIEHDSTKTFGTCFYYFTISNSGISVALATNGWSGNTPTGAQYLDWHTLPASINAPSSNSSSTDIFSYSTTSGLVLNRFTSQLDSKQSWFVLSQTVSGSTTRSKPFSFLHKNTALHSWLDLSKGCISGFTTVSAHSNNYVGRINFSIEENLRRCLSIGSALRGVGSPGFHAAGINTNCYYGAGMTSDDGFNFNISGDFRGNEASGMPLPIGRNAANPAYSTDYTPICSNLPWNLWTPTRLANDFGVYVQYNTAAPDVNPISLGTKIIVQTTVNEWETLQFANSSVLITGATPIFLARVI
jgi:hypothetical protein